jgi:hypothetical protein
VAAGLAPEKWSRFGGVLLSATVAGRPSFKRLRVDTDRLSNRLELRVRAGTDGPELPASALPLRPNGVGTPFTFLLSNPTAAPQTVAVRLTDPPREIATLTVPPGKSVPLVFPPPPAANPPGAAPPTTTLPAPDAFRFQLLDPKTRGELQAFSVPVKLLEPGESLTVREAVFRPGGDGKPGELAAVVAERETFRGPPMAVGVAVSVRPADTSTFGRRHGGGVQSSGCSVLLGTNGLGSGGFGTGGNGSGDGTLGPSPFIFGTTGGGVGGSTGAAASGGSPFGAVASKKPMMPANATATQPSVTPMAIHGPDSVGSSVGRRLAGRRSSRSSYSSSCRRGMSGLWWGSDARVTCRRSGST